MGDKFINSIVIMTILMVLTVLIAGIYTSSQQPPLVERCAKVVEASCVGGIGVKCRVQLQGGHRMTVERIVLVGDPVCWWEQGE